MIRSTPKLEQLDRRWARERLGRLDYPAALQIFSAMWRHGRALDPDFPRGDWRRDLEPDLAVARAINGLPPDA